MKVTWLGHGTWALEIGETKIVLDPFLDDSPTAPVKADEVDADFILVSHGHFDHVADVAKIATRCQSTVVAIFEITEWFRSNHSIETLEPMNRGGGIDLPFGRVTMTVAEHSSQLPDGSYGGEAAGFVIEAEGKRVYFACDTALFSDMKQIGEGGLDLAVLPIGDRFTMGPADAVQAATYLNAKRVAPAHYNTWPPIEQDAAAWAEQIRSSTSSEPVVLQPGETLEL
jgi:L-ascorbate metabolism protein UlaG (beta-lactamase superfamily)